MQRRGGGGGGMDPFFGFGDPFGGFGGFGSSGPPGSLFSSVFGGRNPFDDPFFTNPFGGGMFQSGLFGGPSGFPFPSHMQPSGFPFHPDMHPAGFLEQQARAPEPTSRRGPIIEELSSDDENEDATKEKKENPRKQRRLNNEPTVEYPDDEVEGKKGRHLQGTNQHSRYNATVPQPQARSICFQSSTVSYGGPNGTYYTSSKTRRTGSDGVTFEESKEADTSTRQASHIVSRGLHEKGHTLSRKLNPDGKVDTMQTLHNINEDELTGFEEEWKGKGKKYMPGWSGRIGAGHSGQPEQIGWGVGLLPSSERSHPVGTSEVRGKTGSSIPQERLRGNSNDRGAYHPGRRSQN